MACSFRTIQRLPIDGVPALELHVCRTRFGVLAFLLVAAEGGAMLAQASTREGALEAIPGALRRLFAYSRKAGVA